MNAREYKHAHTVDLGNFQEVVGWWRQDWKSHHQILGDNRVKFRTIFGKPHFRFRGNHYFHVWIIPFEGSEFVVLTAKDHGTCFEQVGGAVDPETRIKFLEYMLTRTADYKPEPVLTKKQRRVRRIVRELQKYMNTYDKQASYLDYTDETIINDVLYGLGIALDKKNRFADGFNRFKGRLQKHIGGK